ncbi:putative murein hydrolase (TIGR00659 family) [Neobacillus niacini]|uniref:LrgB family protein n=1 Tax=Neobacillus niacini TaxID=86668 RepID=UPI0028565B8B|nr:LrgB family protein [Neobacillus niacini]MDR7079851.1 putative murein hydrolase (TIGR00659 family) [Neobacillus niacini]
MPQVLLAFFMILLTVVVYFAMTKLYKRYSYSYLLPILTTSVLIIIILLLLNIPYKNYMMGGQWINSLLGPAVAALAYPLYKQRHFLMNNLFTIVGGVLIATISGMVSIGLLAKIFGINHTLILSIIPKSLTTPVAMEVAKGLGGNASIAIFSVVIAGILGAIAAPTIFKFMRVHSPIGRGIALGSASHSMGTSKAAEYSELTFSMSSVSMALCAIIGTFLGPIVVRLFHF